MSKRQEQKIKSLEAELSAMAIKYAQALREVIRHEDAAKQRHIASAVIDHVQSIDEAFESMYNAVRRGYFENKDGIRYRGSSIDHSVTLLIDISEAV